jgi:hypothetical protein
MGCKRVMMIAPGHYSRSRTAPRHELKRGSLCRPCGKGRVSDAEIQVVDRGRLERDRELEA